MKPLEILESYREHLKNNSGLLPRSQKKYVNIIRAFLRKQGDGEISQEINKFLSDREDAFYKYAFKYFLKLIEREDAYSKLIKIRIRPAKRHGVFISRADQIKILVNLPNDKCYAVAVIQFYTGARSHDVLGLGKKDIVLKPEGITFYFRAKGEKENIGFISSDFPGVKVIYDFIQNSKRPYPFLQGKNKNIISLIDNNYRYYYNAVKEAAIRAGFKGFNTHDFRRNFGTALYRITKDPLLVKAALGHANFKDTMKYIQEVDRDKITAAMKKMQEEEK